MKVLAIDPGTEQSAWIHHHGFPLRFGIVPNAEMRNVLEYEDYDLCAIEMIASYGQRVGSEVFDTCIWIGRFVEWSRAPVVLVPRRQVTTEICPGIKAGDPEVRASLIESYGPGKKKAIGGKKEPGPLYGISKDVWSALAIAETVCRLHLRGQQDKLRRVVAK